MTSRWGRAAGLTRAEGDGGPNGDLVPSAVLTSALWLGLWVTASSVVLAIAGGLGPQPERRIVIGLLLLAMNVAALCWRDRVRDALRTRPWLVLVLTAVLASAAALDESGSGPYLAIGLTALALAVVVANAPTVWLCVAVLEVVHIGAMLLQEPELSGRALAGVLGHLLGYPFAAFVLLTLARLFSNFVVGAGPMLQAIRAGQPALTPALTRAIHRGARGPLLLGAAPAFDLTPREIEVADGLANGFAAKQLAHAWGVSLYTVRTHIASLKRKTGARTLGELAAMTARTDWPSKRDDS